MRKAILFCGLAILLTGSIDLTRADQLRPLIDDLQSGDTQVTLQALQRLGESGDIRAVPPLLQALGDDRGVVRQYAVEALQHLIQALDGVYMVVKRGLQSLIDKLRLESSDDLITVEQPDAPSLGKGVFGRSRAAS
jgi:HEAT repeat protein